MTNNGGSNNTNGSSSATAPSESDVQLAAKLIECAVLVKQGKRGPLVEQTLFGLANYAGASVLLPGPGGIGGQARNEDAIPTTTTANGSTNSKAVDQQAETGPSNDNNNNKNDAAAIDAEQNQQQPPPNTFAVLGKLVGMSGEPTYQRHQSDAMKASISARNAAKFKAEVWEQQQRQQQQQQQQQQHGEEPSTTDIRSPEPSISQDWCEEHFTRGCACKAGRGIQPQVPGTPTTTTTTTASITTAASSAAATAAIPPPPAASSAEAADGQQQQQKRRSSQKSPLDNSSNRGRSNGTNSSQNLSSSSGHRRTSSGNGGGGGGSGSTNNQGRTRPAFTRPVNPKSTLIANGWIEQQRKSKIRTIWKEVLCSLVEARRSTEETTLWIQREVNNKGKRELEALHQVPIKFISDVQYIDGSQDHRFSLRVLNLAEEFVFRCPRDEDAAQNWVLTLRSTVDASQQQQKQQRSPTSRSRPPRKERNPVDEWDNDKRKAAADEWENTVAVSASAAASQQQQQDVPFDEQVNSQPEQQQQQQQAPASTEGGVKKMSVKELRAIAHGFGIKTHGMERGELESVVQQQQHQQHFPAPRPQQEPQQQQQQQPPASPHPEVVPASSSSSPTPADHASSSASQRMTVKELRAIAHGAGVNTMGMERGELEAVVAGVNANGGNAPSGAPAQPPFGAAKQPSPSRARTDEEELQRNRQQQQQQEEAERLRQQQKQQQEEATKRAAAQEEERRRLEMERLQREEEAHKRRVAEQQAAEQRRRQEEALRVQQQQWQQQQQQWQQHQAAEEERRRLAEQQAAEEKRRQEAYWRQQQWHQATQQPQHQQQQQQHPFGPPPPAYQQHQQPPQWHQQQQQWPPQHQHQPSHHRQSPNPFGAPPPQPPPNGHPPQPQAASAIGNKYAKMASQAEDGEQMAIQAIKRGVLVNWALQPPMMQTLRPIEELITSIQSVFPPNFGVSGHPYFAKWTPVTPDEVSHGPAAGNRPDDEKLKKVVRKLRFFLHPDKLPKDLTPAHTFMCKMLWDITNDSYEDFKRKEEDLGWTRG